MSLKTSIYRSTGSFSGERVSKVTPLYTAAADKIRYLKEELDTADAIVIGAGAGLSASAGMSYSGERFEKTFADFHQKYGITDMYSGGFYPFDTLEEYWAWWSRHILVNRYEAGVGANTPVIIKYPFWQMTARNPKAVYACINKGESMCPQEIRKQSICIDDDIAQVLCKIKEL